jgi:SAM-dependent MidA family methyltransferase
MTPLFGRALAAQVAEALQRTGTTEVWEFGGGSGALALHMLQALDARAVPACYTIVEVSASLRARQQALLAGYGNRVRWADALPAQLRGVIIGNEVLDAMPVKLLARVQGQWRERGVASNAQGDFAWEDRDTALQPPLEPQGAHDYLTEIHPQAEAFVRTLAERLVAGAAFFIDYGFPEHEYYHPERHMGTLMCHRAHRADADPLQDVGQKDITAHVNFTGVALAAQDAGLDVLGYCSQARFLMNCGLLADLEDASWADKAMAQKLILEHEMGELFKVLGLCRGEAWPALGFAQGDRTRTL